MIGTRIRETGKKIEVREGKVKPRTVEAGVGVEIGIKEVGVEAIAGTSTMIKGIGVLVEIGEEEGVQVGV